MKLDTKSISILNKLGKTVTFPRLLTINHERQKPLFCLKTPTRQALELQVFRPESLPGNLQILALQLAQSPGDVQAILQALNQEKQLEQAYKIQVLETLLKADAIEGWQLTEVGKLAIKDLMGTAEKFLPTALSSTNNEQASAQIQSNKEPNWEKNEDEYSNPK